MIISIPVKKANLRYLRTRYLFNDVMKVSRQNVVCHILQELLKPKPRQYAPMDASNFRQLNVELYDVKVYAHLIYLDPNSVTAFNHYVDEVIRVEFMAHMHALIEYAQLDINESVYHFLEKYQFEEDEYTFEALSRYYHRAIKKREESLIPV